VSLVVRTWNVFHGNSVPPERSAFLEEMVRLVTADRPAIVCLQEVPVWALPRLDEWSAMTAFGAVAARPRVRSIGLARRITDLHHGLLRSAVTGEANVVLVAPDLVPREPRTEVIGTNGVRRVCQVVRVDEVGVVANFHASGGPLADAQFRRAARFAEEIAGEEPVVLAGDANIRPGDGDTYAELHDLGFSEPVPGSIDQVLVRGLPATSPDRWPEARRIVGGRVLSDHAPVELRVA